MNSLSAAFGDKVNMSSSEMGGIWPASSDASSSMESRMPASCDGRGAGGMEP